MLRGGQVYRPGEEAFCSRRSLPHGHVAAVLGVCRQLGLERLLQRTRSPDFPGERLLVCLNPRLRHERARKKVDKHFAIEVTDDEIRWSRKQDKINAEAQLDGIYVIRTSLQSSALGAPEAVEAYKSLAHVERAFRSLKTAQLAVRPIFVYSEDHVRGHILLCMLAYYVEWHLRRRLAPLLFEEEDRAGARALRQSPVEKAQVSASTKAKAASKQTPEELPVHSFQPLLADLGTLTLNQVTLPDAPQHPFPMVAKPTPLQAKAFDLLGVDPGKFVASKLAG